MAEFIIKSASWDADKTDLMSVREEVFVKGQNVPSSLESDDFDPVSFYVLAESKEGIPIGEQLEAPRYRQTNAGQNY